MPDGLDPEEIRRSLDRSRNRPPRPTDGELEIAVRISSVCDEIRGLEIDGLAQLTPEQEAKRVEHIQALNVRLQRLEDAARQEARKPRPEQH
jgi:hypothetical protein